jgi:hypothetical protein
MMSNPRWLGRGGCLLAFMGLGGWLGLVTPAAGRIGESQPAIEDRLTSPASQKLSEPLTQVGSPDTGGYQGGGRRGRGQGQQSQLISVPEGFDFQIVEDLVIAASGAPAPETPGRGGARKSGDFNPHYYFKTDDGSSAQTRLNGPPPLTGWEYQVYLYKGVSVLEIYRRLGQDLTDPEIDLLLELNHGKSTWQHASMGASTLDQKTDSFLGYDYTRADGEVRGMRKGNDLVLFSAGLDKRLLDMMEKARQVENTTSKGTAPVSVRGF